MLANFGDLRFSDNDGVTELCYWIENYNSGENAIVWVRVPSIPANDNHTIYMYYGNPHAEVESSGSAVFEFFDNFDNATKFSTVAYPYGDPNFAFPENSNFVEFGNNGNEEYVKLGSYDEGELRENLNLPKENYKIIVAWRTANDQFSFNNADYTNYDDKYGASTTTPKRLIVINENKIYEKDNRLLSYSEKTEVSCTSAIDNFYLSVGSSGGGGDNPYFTYYDLAFIRKFTDPEPVTSVGEEESNVAPSAPNLLEPENNAHENDTTPLFRWENSIDSEGDSISYTLQIDNEASFTAPLVYENTQITENQYELPTENALSDDLYYWRVGARDMVNPDNWSKSSTFTIDTVPPSAPSPQSPLNGAITNDNTPSLRWTVITIENSFPITYELQVDNDNNFLSPEVNAIGLVDNTYTPTYEFTDGNYSWRVRARDNAGNAGPWSVVWTFLIDTIPPGVPTLVLPENGALLGTPDVSFSWTKPESGVAYQIQIDNEASFTSPYVHENQSITDNTYSYTFARARTYYWRVCARDEAGNWGRWSDNFKLTIEVPVPPRTPHDPIYIKNNDYFNLDNGVVAGAGVENEPYIIENWVISAKNANGIWVANTDAYFIIRNCLVENGGTNYFGIYMQNLVNGKVENCKSENNIYGIYLKDSTKNNATNNTCSNNHAFHGILLENSCNNTIANNTCSNNAWYGITLNYYSSNNILNNNNCSNNVYGIYLRFWSDNNTALNNTCSNNAYGIGLSSSDNDILDNNTCSNNFRGIYLDNSSDVKMRNNILSNNQYNFGVTGTDNSHFIQDIDPSNLVNGKSIRYLVGNRDEVIAPPLGIGYLALVNCDNIHVKNLAFRNNRQGILLVSTRDSLVENCVIENNFCCAYLYSSNNNFIYHNNFLGNGSQGRDDGSNYWDNGYPSGGNYWSDYTGKDNYRGENQNIPGGDGIGDTPYYIPGNSNADRYPFVNSWPPIIGVKVSISPSYQGGPPRATLIYMVYVTNTGTVDDTYNLTVIDNAGWNLMLTDNLFENVAPGKYETTILIVVIPDNENLIGVRDNITVTAISQESENVSDNATCIAYVGEGFTSNLNLVAGWNLMSFPVTSENDTPDNIFAGQTYTIWRWDAVKKKYFSPSSAAPVELGVGYWIWVGYNQTVTMSGVPVDNYSINLVAGWNLVGFPVTNENTTPDNIFAGQTYNIWKWNAENNKYVSPPSDQPVELGVGYWIWVEKEMTITVPL